MRNLKRALSLGLTAAMISGLMVMGSSAASYADVTSEDNQEAIEVLQAVEIMVGDENGDFNPDQNVTRNEMAVIMSNLMEYNVASYKNTSPFTDVPAWAEPYVAACWTNGITAGYSDTIYGGSDTVTTAQAALMLMKALGYFQYSQDFGADWQLATVKQGNAIDLFVGVDSGVTQAMTRNDVAQLVLNALQAGTVEAETDGSISVGDITINSGVTYKFVTSGSDYATAINDNKSTSANSINGVTAPIVELGEKLYQGDLTKEDGYDDFGRPAAIWSYENDEIGRYAEDATYTFTAKVTPDELYDSIGRTAANYEDWNVTVDGKNVAYDGDDLIADRNDDDDCFLKNEDQSQTGNGVLTQVYVDNTDKTVDIAVIHTYAAEVSRVRDEDGERYITLNDLTGGPATSSDHFVTDQFEEDDIVLYTYAENDIQTVALADDLSGEVTRVKETDSFVVDGTTYKYTFGTNTGDMLNAENVDNNVVAYLDAYGYVIYIDESAMTYDYAFVLDVGKTGSKYNGDDVYGATLLLTDGTVVEADLDTDAHDYADRDAAEDALENYIVSYTVDDEMYTLKVMNDEMKAEQGNLTSANLSIENDRAKMTIGGETIYGNNNTVFLLDDGDDNYSVYTGIKNVPDITGDDNSSATYYCANNSTVARVVYVRDADVEGEGTVVFIEADHDADRIKDTDGNYYELNAVVDGEETTIRVKTGTDAAEILVTNANEGDPYMVAYKSLVTNSDGLVTDVRDFDEADEDTFTGTREYERNDATVGLGYNSPVYYTYSDDVVVVYYDGDDLRTANITSVGDDENDSVIAIFDDGQIIGLCITENDEDEKPEATGYEVVSFNNNPMELTADETGITLKYAKVVDNNGEDYKYGSATLTAVVELYDGGWSELETLTEKVTASTTSGQEHILADSTGVKLDSDLLAAGDRIRVTLTLSNDKMGDITIYDGQQIRIAE